MRSFAQLYAGKINAQKLNPAKTSVDFQQVIGPHSHKTRHVVIINSVELNILLGKAMSAITNPQEKKRLAYKHDRRNSYGQNAKASRKLIPLRKKKGERARRRNSTQIVAGALKSADFLGDDAVENRVAGVQKKRWRKAPDVSLAEAIKIKKEGRVKRFGRKAGKKPNRVAGGN